MSVRGPAAAGADEVAVEELMPLIIVHLVQTCTAARMSSRIGRAPTRGTAACDRRPDPKKQLCRGFASPTHCERRDHRDSAPGDDKDRATAPALIPRRRWRRWPRRSSPALDCRRDLTVDETTRISTLDAQLTVGMEVEDDERLRAILESLTSNATSSPSTSPDSADSTPTRSGTPSSTRPTCPPRLSTGSRPAAHIS